MADSLDKQLPAAFFLKSGELIKAEKYNDAAFLSNLGGLRYGYYNSANRAHRADSDRAFLAALGAGSNELLQPYLRTNIDNYIAILKQSASWYVNHDYAYFPKYHSPAKYDALYREMKLLISRAVKYIR